MLFPRFHQWEAVTNIVAAVAEEGVGHRYLIEHSAGSGKTNTIAWTAHRLARLHVNDEKVFDSVIVVVDRTVLDGQLQEAIRQIDGSGKIVATISPEDVRKAGAKSKSGLLATALKSGELIIAVTVQTFPFALDEIRADSSLKGRKFAVIADEAHSSQSGQISSKLKAVLTAEEVKEIEDGGSVDVEAVLAAEMTERAESENISYFAFTATPKNKTLELFGRKGPDGKPVEFHLYSMRQAIEEGYILDVLRGYQAYETALKIAGKVDESDEVEEGAARKGLMRWVKLHPTNISQKVQIIVEHFHANVAYLLEGKAKGMVVTDSRKAAVRYKRGDRQVHRLEGLRLQHARRIQRLHQRRGVRHRGRHRSLDEPRRRRPAQGVHQGRQQGHDRRQQIPDRIRPAAAVRDVRRQDASGVTAVQTLSRLNRTYCTPSGKLKRHHDHRWSTSSTHPTTIKEAFEPYFTDAYLETTTDPNLVHDIAAKLDQAGIYEQSDIDAVLDAWVAAKGNQALDAALAPALTRYRTRRVTALAANGGQGDAAARRARPVPQGPGFVRAGLRLPQPDRRLRRRRPREALDLLPPARQAPGRLTRRRQQPGPVEPVPRRGQADRPRQDRPRPRRQGRTQGHDRDRHRHRSRPQDGRASQEVIDLLNEVFGGEAFSGNQPDAFVRDLMRSSSAANDAAAYSRRG